MATSVITYRELAYGVRKSPDPCKVMMVLEELIALIPVLPIAADMAKAYGFIRSDLAARGELICNNDLWIAAHTKRLEVILATKHEKKYQRVSGLKIENWSKGYMLPSKLLCK
jgi:tRNA(fMet)-specific endonuclease VapC